MRRGEPLGRELAPTPVGAVHDVAPVGVPEGELGQEPRCRHRPALPGAVPPVQHAESEGPAPPHNAGQVDRTRVLLVGVREAGPLVDRRAVNEEAIGVRRRDVRRGPPDRSRGRGHLGAEVGEAVRLLRGGGRMQPLGLPVGLSQCRREARGCGDRARLVGVAPRPDGPLVGGVARQRGTGVRDEGLLGRRHQPAVPHRRGVTGVRAPDHDAVARLRDLSSRRRQGPRERAVIRVDAHRVDHAVDRQRAGAKRAGRTRGGQGLPNAAGRLLFLVCARRSRGHAGGHGGAGCDAGGRRQEGAAAETGHPSHPRCVIR